jgi:hypothetical protein
MKYKITIKVLTLFSIFLLCFYNNSKSQTQPWWEGDVQFPYSINTYESYKFRHEMVYDNYGVHIICLDASNQLHYRLFGNNGQLIPNSEYINTSLSCSGF